MYLFKFNDGSGQVVKVGAIESVWPSPADEAYDQVLPYIQLQVNGNPMQVNQYQSTMERDDDYNKLIEILEG